MVVLGAVTGPHGVHGWVRVHPFGDDPLSWSKMPVWWLGPEAGPWQEMKISRCRLQGDGLVVAFEGVTDRNQAEALQKLLVAAPRTALPETGENEFYWADLIGAKVLNTRDECLGVVKGLIETGANDVLRVQGEDGEERLIPFVNAVVTQVDQAQGLIRVEWERDW